ncbi:disulfide bond formation protein DsbA [Halonotius terrestris]|uniref:Disulfide bond formation protein DsbA n=1 Tax=Halonotius terrestris TaxID=2487750 RepID=A0A8J8PF31_9EURY|nr:thioredoxin domain-containing protein [Halonotius terrestris]TQQ83507.1 disulfide bond formation protein DsbA [Halonotius terrestris]
MTKRTRRSLLGSAGAAASLTLAGCMGGGSGSSGSSGESSDGVALADHPLGENLAEWPHLGPDPFEAPATLVVLDDPSCSRCAAFHQGTVAELESQYVESGDLSIAVRPYPVVYAWGEPAAHALEATLARDEAAFWALLDHYFAEQGSFNTDNVLDQTETWLGDNTDLDAAAVIDDVDSEAITSRVEATLAAGEEAGAGNITPASFAFVDGALQTSLNGSVSTSTVETALNL